MYNDYKSTFENLLELDNSVSIHHRKIRLLLTELYKVKDNLSNQGMSELFNLRNINYDFRSQADFELGPIYTTGYGVRSLKYFAPTIWNVVPIDIRNSLLISFLVVFHMTFTVLADICKILLF